MIIAQQFTAGTTGKDIVVRKADGFSLDICSFPVVASRTWTHILCYPRNRAKPQPAWGGRKVTRLFSVVR
jgi:hypothetical protein